MKKILSLLILGFMILGIGAVSAVCVEDDSDCDGFIDFTDCNPLDPNICPGAIEICNNIDDDCDGLIDEDLTKVCGTGDCTDISTCNLGIWSECGSTGENCGSCLLFGCGIDGNFNTLEVFTAGEKECNSEGVCSTTTCNYVSFCADSNVQDNSPLTLLGIVVGCEATCDQEEDCPSYCEGDTMKSDATCTSGTCECSYDSHNCNNEDGWYNIDGNTQWIENDQCTEKEQQEQEYRDYSCSEDPEVSCLYSITNTQWINTTNIQPKQDGISCDDGLYCIVNDVCSQGSCVGGIRDCSSNNLLEIAECGHDPDTNQFTWDYASAFLSTCDETQDSCTTDTYDFSHTCDIYECGAECESNDDCHSKCSEDGEVFYFNGACGGCTCTYEMYDCDQEDGWYNIDGNTQWISTGECTEKEQQEQEYRDYSCGEGCNYEIIDHQFVDTNVEKNKENGISCDDGLYCTIGDTCNVGVCQGNSPRDCSSNNLLEIADCGHDPDTNQFTWDYASAFLSTCDETQDSCTTDTYDFSHTCDIDGCGAECESNDDCVPKIIQDFCVYGSDSCLESCSCNYQEEEYCPLPGTVVENICYWGTQDCNEEGCALNEEEIREGEECDPDLGSVVVIDLIQGWNLISIPIVPENSEISNVLGDANVSIVYAYDPFDLDEDNQWIGYIKGILYDLETMNAGYGYWVFADSNTKIKVKGDLIKEVITPPSVKLASEWNLIGHYGLEEKEVYCSLFSLIDTTLGYPRWSALYGYDEIGDNFIPLNTGGYTNPGEGYWIEMDKEDSYNPATICWGIN